MILLVQQALFALLWAVLAVQRMSRRTSGTWAVATGLVSAGMVLVAARDTVPLFVGHWVANMLILSGFIGLRRGVEVFARQRPADAEHAAVLVAHGTLLGVAIEVWPLWSTVPAAAVCVCYVLARTARTIQRSAGPEFGRAIAFACAAPFWLIGAVLLLRGALALAMPASIGASLHDPRPVNVGALVVFVACGLLINFGLLGLVFARVVTRLRHLSDHDALTGLRNRRSIERALSAEAARLARHDQTFALLALDIDHFKSINDRLGHPAGDEVLRALARTMQSAARRIDLAARTGGEEFWLLMPATDQPGAMVVAERLMQAVRQLSVAVAGAEVGVTVSIGVAIASRRDEELESLLRRTDAALYRAKHQGRNRIELDPGPATAARRAAPVAA